MSQTSIKSGVIKYKTSNNTKSLILLSTSLAIKYFGQLNLKGGCCIVSNSTNSHYSKAVWHKLRYSDSCHVCQF